MGVPRRGAVYLEVDLSEEPFRLVVEHILGDSILDLKKEGDISWYLSILEAATMFSQLPEPPTYETYARIGAIARIDRKYMTKGVVVTKPGEERYVAMVSRDRDISVTKNLLNNYFKARHMDIAQYVHEHERNVNYRGSESHRAPFAEGVGVCPIAESDIPPAVAGLYERFKRENYFELTREFGRGKGLLEVIYFREVPDSDEVLQENFYVVQDKNRDKFFHGNPLDIYDRDQVLKSYI